MHTKKKNNRNSRFERHNLSNGHEFGALKMIVIHVNLSVALAFQLTKKYGITLVEKNCD